MTHVKLRVIILLAALLTFSFGQHVFAQEFTPQSNEEVSMQRCTLAQNYLGSIQKPRDLRARVDRLQGYRYIYQRFDMFSKRLERNKQPEAGALRANLVSLNKEIENFKNSYEQYDSAREAVVGVKNCKSNITVFQEKLADARLKRSAVNANVVAIDEILSPKLKGQLETLYQGLLATGTTGEAND